MGKLGKSNDVSYISVIFDQEPHNDEFARYSESPHEVIAPLKSLRGDYYGLVSRLSTNQLLNNDGEGVLAGRGSHELVKLKVEQQGLAGEQGNPPSPQLVPIIEHPFTAPAVLWDVRRQSKAGAPDNFGWTWTPASAVPVFYSLDNRRTFEC